MQPLPQGVGWIEVICGSMFSGKTETLISRLRREMYARKKVQIFKPRTDSRYARDAVVSHTDLRLPSQVCDHPREILDKVHADTAVVGIDEVQFFEDTIADVAQKLADRGYRVICAGLDLDYRGEPFEPMPRLLCLAEYVTKLHAVCTVCGNPAHRSQRLTANESQVLLGSSDRYEARCRAHHSPDPLAAPRQPDLPIVILGQEQAR
ncbi:MAG: thymidine kinase [Myxococcales bacterium]|nr:thymidine kinase [Myxococcales bacterium]MCB9524359.1 thymidine kinase [Myxococcales bacterium]